MNTSKIIVTSVDAGHQLSDNELLLTSSPFTIFPYFDIVEWEDSYSAFSFFPQKAAIWDEHIAGRKPGSKPVIPVPEVYEPNFEVVWNDGMEGFQWKKIERSQDYKYESDSDDWREEDEDENVDGDKGEDEANLDETLWPSYWDPYERGLYLHPHYYDRLGAYRWMDHSAGQQEHGPFTWEKYEDLCRSPHSKYRRFCYDDSPARKGLSKKIAADEATSEDDMDSQDLTAEEKKEQAIEEARLKAQLKAKRKALRKSLVSSLSYGPISESMPEVKGPSREKLYNLRSYPKVMKDFYYERDHPEYYEPQESLPQVYYPVMEALNATPNDDIYEGDGMSEDESDEEDTYEADMLKYEEQWGKARALRRALDRSGTFLPHHCKLCNL